MIEVVSAPADLTTWDGQQEPYYYLELFGETTPVLDTHYAEILPAGPTDGTIKTEQAAPVYEYWWTIGHPGPKRDAHPAMVSDVMATTQLDMDLWANLQEEEGAAARVYVFFPINGNWRIKEMVASLKYLTPVPQQTNWWDTIAQEWKTLSPLVDDASKLAGLAGPTGASVATALSTLAKVQISSVPQTKELAWSVKKVTYGTPPYGVMQGVLWNLPRSIFHELGGRITGSIAVSFIPAHVQQDETAAAAFVPPTPERILAHAVVYGPTTHLWSPGPDAHHFIKLQIAPQVPAPPPAK